MLYLFDGISYVDCFSHNSAIIASFINHLSL